MTDAEPPNVRLHPQVLHLEAREVHLLVEHADAAPPDIGGLSGQFLAVAASAALLPGTAGHRPW